MKSVVGVLEKYKLDLGGKGRDIKQQKTVYFSMEKEMLIIN
jgi:hypothetical protein